MERLRVMTCDHLNLARSKYLALSKQESGITRMCRGLYALTYKRDLLPAPGSKMLEGLPDMDIIWNPDDARNSWVEGEKILIADQCESEGDRLSLCGRSALKQAISEWQDMGYSPMVGIELEAFAFVKNEDGELEPLSTPGSFVYSTGVQADPVGFTDAIWEAAQLAALPLELITTEYDESQFEFVLTFTDALATADNIFIFRQLAKEVALECGIVLTFMPKPIEERGGNGIHINFSFLDNQGNNVIASGKSGGIENMSALARNCIAGLMHHHKALAGLIAPTVNSYARLQPASMSGYWQNWGGDHRSVTARLSSEGGMAARIEHRMADGGANIYTTIAAVLQAARLGVIHQYPLAEPETGDGFEELGTDVGVAQDLSHALTDLETDTVFCETIGTELVANHIFIKRAEIDEVNACENETAKRDYYIHYI